MIDYNAIQSDILAHKKEVEDGDYDVYLFISDLSEKHVRPFDPLWEDRCVSGDDPYTDLLMAMVEINGISLY